MIELYIIPANIPNANILINLFWKDNFLKKKRERISPIIVAIIKVVNRLPIIA